MNNPLDTMRALLHRAARDNLHITHWSMSVEGLQDAMASVRGHDLAVMQIPEGDDRPYKFFGIPVENELRRGGHSVRGKVRETTEPLTADEPVK